MELLTFPANSVRRPPAVGAVLEVSTAGFLGWILTHPLALDTAPEAGRAALASGVILFRQPVPAAMRPRAVLLYPRIKELLMGARYWCLWQEVQVAVVRLVLLG